MRVNTVRGCCTRHASDSLIVMTEDTNAVVAAALRDLAALQTSKQSEWGYRGAAAAIFGMDELVESLRTPGGKLQKIASVGPKSERVVLEVLQHGHSPTVERAIDQSGKRAEIDLARSLRRNFLSRARALRILADATLTGPSRATYRGDLQMHSIWSDGSQTLDEIVHAGRERGYAYCGLTDHSHGLKIARGASMPELRQQHADIDAVNAEQEGTFRLIKGVEANIMADGSIDVAPEERREFELILAAPHSGLRSTADQTARMIAAVRSPGVHVLAHPRGRMYGRRAGIQGDWPAIFAAAAEANVAVEIDGDPARQDLDFEMVREALAAGCLIALDSDAHAPDQLRYADIAMAHARLAGIPVDRVINCWPAERLLGWLAGRT
jgi:putative hydrolase